MRAVPEPFRPAATATSQRILVDPAAWIRGAEPAGQLGVLQAAVFSGRRLRLRYRSSGRRTAGTSEPHRRASSGRAGRAGGGSVRPSVQGGDLVPGGRPARRAAAVPGVAGDLGGGGRGAGAPPGGAGRPGRGGRGGGREVHGIEYAFASGLDWPDERLGPGIAARRVRRGEGSVARRARAFGPADAAGARRLGRPAPRVAGGVGSGVRRSGREGSVAGGETAHVRQGGGGSPAALLLRRGRAAARSAAHRRPGGAERALRTGARRAVPHGGTVPVPGRPGQRRLARRHHRARQA